MHHGLVLKQNQFSSYFLRYVSSERQSRQAIFSGITMVNKIMYFRADTSVIVSSFPHLFKKEWFVEATSIHGYYIPNSFKKGSRGEENSFFPLFTKGTP